MLVQKCTTFCIQRNLYIYDEKEVRISPFRNLFSDIIFDKKENKSPLDRDPFPGAYIYMSFLAAFNELLRNFL
jgi:hypothetical protein